VSGVKGFHLVRGEIFKRLKPGHDVKRIQSSRALGFRSHSDNVIPDVARAVNPREFFRVAKKDSAIAKLANPVLESREDGRLPRPPRGMDGEASLRFDRVLHSRKPRR
jgi:hypothetical protein